MTTEVTTTPPDVETPLAIAEAEAMIPQSKVNALIAAARREGESRATKKAPDVESLSLQDQMASIKAELATEQHLRKFDRGMLGQGFTPKQADTLYRLFVVDKPTDVQEWLAQTVESLGIQNGSQAQTQSREIKAAPPDSIPKTVEFAHFEKGKIPINSLSKEQSRDPKFIRQTFTDRWELERQNSGAPRPPKKPPGK